MKKGSLVFNIAVVIALVVLYILHFSSNKSADVINTDLPQQIRETAVNDSSINIVYVDLQKLLVEYKFAEQINIDFIKRKGTLQDQLDSQVKKYEKDAMAFQEKLSRGNFLSQASAESQESELYQRQQELRQLQYELEDKLSSEQNNMNVKLYDSIINYLEEYNSVYNYQYILSKVDGSNLLVADTTLDITNEIVKVLNERYKGNIIEE